MEEDENAGFEVLTEVTVNTTTLWNATLWSGKCPPSFG
jgi:hypothetical protein